MKITRLNFKPAQQFGSRTISEAQVEPSNEQGVLGAAAITLDRDLGVYVVAAGGLTCLYPISSAVAVVEGYGVEPKATEPPKGFTKRGPTK